MNKGQVAIIIAIIILSVLLVIGLGVSVLALQQLQMSSQVGESVTAIYASEAGVEKCLYQVFQEEAEGCDSENGGPGFIEGSVDIDDTWFRVEYYSPNRMISVGRYRDVYRSLELSF